MRSLTFSLSNDSGKTVDADTAQQPSGLSLGICGSLDMPCKTGRFYVYRHRAPNGKVFYVGKGTGNRA